MATFYRANFTVTNGIAFDASEAVSWGGGASTGTFVAVRTATQFDFLHLTGPAPIVTDVIDGDVTNAQRTISSWGTTAANPFIEPFDTGFTSETTVNAFEVSVDLVTALHAVSPFRSVFLFLAPLLTANGFLFHLPTSRFPDTPDDFLGVSYGASAAGPRLTFSAQFTPPSEGQSGALRRISGLVYPRWYRGFENVDSSGVSWPHLTTREAFASGDTLRIRMAAIAQVVEPAGNLLKALTGEYTPLTGSHTLWQVDVAINTGRMQTIGIVYISTSFQGYLAASSPITIAPEWFTDWPAATPTLATHPIDFRYHQMRVYDSATRAWREIQNFTQTNTPKTGDPDYGWSAQVETGKLTASCGTSSVYRDNVVGKCIFTGLTYQNATTLVDLPAIGLVAFVVGSTTQNGPTWRSGAGAPYAQQEHDHGYIVLKPGTNDGACATHTCVRAGTYRFVGDFAFSNDAASGGNGVNVAVVHRETVAILFADVIEPPDNGDTPDPFGTPGTGKVSFDVTQALAVGERVQFIVTSRAQASFDETAFRVQIDHVRAASQLSPAAKGERHYVPPGAMPMNFSNDTGLLFPELPDYPIKLVGTTGLRQEVYFFSDADTAEVWHQLPDGCVAVAFAQSESDASGDLAAFLNADGQLEFVSTAGNRKSWVHVWRRSTVRPGTTGSSTPPVSKGAQGFVPRGTGVYTNDLTLAGNNLANGRIVGIHGLRHRVYGFTEIRNGDTYTGQAGIVATAFQPVYETGFAKLRVTARTDRSTTITFDTDAPFEFITGFLHTWSR